MKTSNVWNHWKSLEFDSFSWSKTQKFLSWANYADWHFQTFYTFFQKNPGYAPVLKTS